MENEPRDELVLLTGATGLLGGHLVGALRAAGYGVRALVRPSSPEHERKVGELQRLGVEVHPGDLLRAADLGRACRRVDAIVHAAAHRGAWSREHTLQHHVNVDGTAALMRAAFAAKVRRVVHVSTVGALGATRRPVALDEDGRWSFDGTPRLQYLLTKREAEERVLHALRNGLPALVVNPGALVGRPADGSPPRALTRELLRGAPRRLPKGGASFAAVGDVAASIVRALQVGRIGERYVLGGANLAWTELYAGAARRLGHGHRYRTWPNTLGRLLAGAALAVDGVGLARPAWAPERFRAWGWFAFADSTKAVRELGHPVPTLTQLLERALGPPASGAPPGPALTPDPGGR